MEKPRNLVLAEKLREYYDLYHKYLNNISWIIQQMNKRD